MGGLGLGEVLLILLLILLPLGFAGFVGVAGLFGFGGRRKSLWKGSPSTFESRVLDELEVLRVRMDALAQRLDEAGISGRPGDPRLPGGEEEGQSPEETRTLDRESPGHEGGRRSPE